MSSRLKASTVTSLPLRRSAEFFFEAVRCAFTEGVYGVFEAEGVYGDFAPAAEVR